MELNTKIKSHCRICNHSTNHLIKALETQSASNEDFGYTEKFAIVQCLGCDTFSFRKEYSDTDSYSHDEEGYDPGITANIYPPITKNHTRLDDLWRLPPTINQMYNESIDALSAGCRTLAGAGLRAVIEAICMDKKISGDDLKAKIKKLANKQYITPVEEARMHSIRFLGNDSVHDAKTPTEEQLTIALQIVEHLLTNIYLIDAQAYGKLESVITDYETFKLHLTRLLKKYKAGEEHTLYSLFGKDVRRIEDTGQAFEDKLVEEITNGTYTLLSVAAAVPNPDPNSKKPMSPRFILNS
jgi:hypothetical protein